MKKSITTLCCILLFAVCGIAQEYVLHENSVRPSMTEQYNAAVLKLKEACLQNKVDVTWNTFIFDDNTYAHVLPVKGKALADADLFADLKSKIGEDAFGKLVSEFETSVDSKKLGTFVYMPEHSYLDPKPDETFRSILHLIPLPGKEVELENLLAEWRNAFQSRKATENYHIYKFTIGPEVGYIVSLSAKNPADMAGKRAHTNALLQDLGTQLWNKQLTLVRKFYWKRGYYNPSLGYRLPLAN